MLRFFEERYGRAVLKETVAEIGAELEDLENPDAWVSANLVRRFNHALVARTEEPLLTYEAGLAMSTPGIAGPTYYLMKSLGSPRLVYSKAYELSKPQSRIAKWSVISVDDGSAVLRYAITRGQVDDPLFCLNRQGALAGIPTIFDLPAARVAQPKCIHRGDPCCEYHVTWMKPSLVNRWAGIAFVAMAGGTGLLVATGMVSLAALWVPGLCALGLGAAYVRDLRSRLRTLTEEGQAQLVKNMTQVVVEGQKRQQELMLLARIDQLTRRHYEVKDLLDTVLREITMTLGYDRAMFMLADKEAGKLGKTRTVGFDPELRQVLESFEVSLEPEGNDELLFANILRRRQTVLVVDIEDYRNRLRSEQSRKVLDALKPDAFVAVPIYSDGDVFGLLVVDQTTPERTLTIRDKALLEQLGHRLAMALANVRLVDNLKQRQRAVERALMLNQKLSLYLPVSAVDHILRRPDAALKLGGRRIRAAVLFADIVGFTPWTEANEPEVVVEALNHYFAAMDDVIEEYYGILDKRMGDGMMVVFLERDAQYATSTGEFVLPHSGKKTKEDDDVLTMPMRLAHPARRAIQCALQMQRSLRKFNRRMLERARLSFSVRTGIAYGEVVAGNIGSSHRLEYTVIGDVVNVASRLGSSAKAGAIFTNAETLASAGEGFTTKYQGELKVKGHVKPVRTYEVLYRRPNPALARGSP